MAFRNPLIDALVILVIVLVIFGPKRLPQIGKGLGDGIREFKDSITSRGSASRDDEPPGLAESRAAEAAPPVDAAVAGTPRPAPDAPERAS